jgi:hypothetical protein
MHSNSTRKTLKAIALSFAAAAVFTGTASGKVGDHAASQPGPSAEIPYLSHGQGIQEGTFTGDDALLRAGLVSPSGLPDVLQWDVPGGVTPPNLARAYEQRYEGVAQPDGHQPQLRGEEPLVIRDAPDGFVPKTSPSDVVSVSASSDGFDRDDVAIGFGLGLILATACAMALAAASGRQRMAHS